MKILRRLNACGSGAGWAESQVSYRDAWDRCERGDWMLWIAKKRNIDIKKLTAAKVGCARLVQHLMTDERSINALDVAEAFSRGDATIDELRAAAYAAAAAAAADAAAYAADAADAAAAKNETLKKAADICRKHITFDDLSISEVDDAI